MTICHCMLPLTNQEVCKQCPNKTSEDFSFISPVEYKYVAPPSEPLYYIDPNHNNKLY